MLDLHPAGCRAPEERSSRQSVAARSEEPRRPALRALSRLPYPPPPPPPAQPNPSPALWPRGRWSWRAWPLSGVGRLVHIRGWGARVPSASRACFLLSPVSSLRGVALSRRRTGSRPGKWLQFHCFQGDLGFGFRFFGLCSQCAGSPGPGMEPRPPQGQPPRSATALFFWLKWPDLLALFRPALVAARLKGGAC